MIKPNKQNAENGNGRRYWRSLDELHGDPQLDAAIDHEFAAAAPPNGDGVSRRRWLQIMGASMAFGTTLAGCRYPAEKLAPFAFRPHGRTPGVPESFSTLLELGGVARPVVSISYDGRPIKLDGNPDHPDTKGGSDKFIQAAILQLYDPDRSRQPIRKIDGASTDSTWEDAIDMLRSRSGDTGMAVLCEPASSPTVQRLKKKLLAGNSATRWFEFSSISPDNSDAGARMAFGDTLRPVHELARAEVVVCLDADPLGVDPAVVRNSVGFTASRDADHGHMSRLYSVECNFSTTGASADHRLPLRFSQIGPFLAAVEAALDAGPGKVDPAQPEAERMVAAIAGDLQSHPGRSAIIVGDSQPPEVHARAFRLNSRLKNIGQTVSLVKPEGAMEKSGVEQLKELTEAIRSGAVQTLVILGGNPVFYAPSDLGFDEALASVTNSVHLSLYHDETSRKCTWHLNAAHPLESWGDGRSVDGSVLLAQPLIEPLFHGWSAIELLAVMTGEAEPPGHGHGHGHGGDDHGSEKKTGKKTEHKTAESFVHDDTHIGMVAVQATHHDQMGNHSAQTWEKGLHDGYFEGTAATPASPPVKDVKLPADDGSWRTAWSGGEPELVFRPSPGIYDGRFANNGWLQELPEFITKLTWDNAALVSPTTATALNMEQGKIADLKVGEHTISLPVYILPGLPAGTICTWLGYGREAAGRVAGDADYRIDSVGKDIRPLRTSGNWWSVPAVSVVPTGTSYLLVSTQDHFGIDAIGRNEINQRMAPQGDMIREGSWASYQEFQAAHPADGHSDHGDGKTAADEHAADEHAADAHGKDGHAEDDHGHGHGHAHWPTGHHLHFPNFDLTPAGWTGEPVAHKWGMAIDLNRCTGCNSCVIACQAENNIPVVGKDQVSRGREMQWMRIDRYFITETDDTDGQNPLIAHQPVTCQQCENAPCETVCPVAATVHSDEGLNDMVYNRCIGTRYCGNNCPFKVRRFNYLNYTDSQTFIKLPGADRLDKANLQLQNMMMNPEVTIRSRGVMEKCTFCVQRIQNARINARAEGNRPIGPNEIRTACQDACPAEAIYFGDIQNAESDVSGAHANPRAYSLLDSLNVLPRNRYLARVRNPHPDLDPHVARTAH